MGYIIYLTACIVNPVILRTVGVTISDWQWWASMFCIWFTYIATKNID